VARATWLPIDVHGRARFIRLAATAAKEALAFTPALRARIEATKPSARAKVHVFVGLPEARAGRPEGLDDFVARALESVVALRDPVGSTVTLAEGHAASLMAIEQAAALIRSGDADLCLAGGVDSWLEPAALGALDTERRIFGPNRPWGFTPGEAAGFCVLASSRWSARHGMTPSVSLAGAGSSREPAPMGSRQVCIGRGLGNAFEGALSCLESGAEGVTHLVGDLNGEPYRADELGFARSRFADRFATSSAPIVPASSWGDVGAASGALFTGLVLDRALRGVARDTHSLVWASSDGGRRAAALFRSHALDPNPGSDS